MNIEWDEKKRQINLHKHGIDFIRIEAVFEGETFTIKDDRYDYGEIRFVTFGFLEGRVVAVVHTDNFQSRRIISVRKATKNEQIKFYKKITDGLGAD